MTERQIETALVKAVKAAGGLALKLLSPGAAGVPDRLVLLRIYRYFQKDVCKRQVQTL